MKPQILFISLTLTLSIFAPSCAIANQPNNLSRIIDMAWQEDKYLWVSNDDKLIRWNTQTKEPETFKNISGELLVDSKNTLWVFDTSTISHFDGRVWEHFTSGEDFAKGGILSFVEANGYIWVGTRGLSRYNQQNQSWEILLQTTPGPEPTPIPGGAIVEALVEGIHSMAPANKEAMWLGTDRGLTYWQDDFQQTWGNNALNTEGVRCILGVSENEVWICTELGFGRRNGSQLVDFFEDHGHNKQLVQGEGQEVWATGDEGVSKWDGVLWNNWTTTQESTPSRKAGVLGEGDSAIVVTTVEPKATSLREARSLIVSTTNSNIWVISARGIIRWNGRQWRTYTNDDGLRADFTYVLIQDARGIPWAGTNNGIYYYDSNTDQWQPFP